MKSRHIIIAMLAMVLLSSGAMAKGISDLSIYSNNRFESHSIGGTTKGDNVITSSFTFITNTGHKSSVMGSIGQRFDIEDSQFDNLALSLSYLHNFTKSSYLMTSYSNFKTFESIDDALYEDTTDMFYFMHGWKVVKRDLLQVSFFTALSTDTAFDDNRMLSETVRFSGPVFKRFRWNVSYQLGYSLVDDNQSINAWDAGMSTAISRNAIVSLGYRYVQYLDGAGFPSRDLDDNIWILSYSHRLR